MNLIRFRNTCLLCSMLNTNSIFIDESVKTIRVIRRSGRWKRGGSVRWVSEDDPSDQTIREMETWRISQVSQWRRSEWSDDQGDGNAADQSGDVAFVFILLGYNQRIDWTTFITIHATSAATVWFRHQMRQSYRYVWLSQTYAGIQFADFSYCNSSINGSGFK
jgi:hypothetical protein